MSLTETDGGGGEDSFDSIPSAEGRRGIGKVLHVRKSL